MAYNGILMNNLLNELNEKLVGGRINKIYQPNDKVLTFTIRNHGDNFILYLSAHSNFAHVNIIDSKLNNPQKPPNFCMLLRKYLQNGFITKIEQIGLERIYIFHIDSADDLGYVTTKRIVVEIMGKHSNITVIDENDKIYDSIKRVSPLMSKKRQIMPNQDFKFLEITQQDFRNVDKKDFLNNLDNNKKRKIYKHLYFHYQGFGPKLAKEILNRSGIDFKIKIKDLNKNQIDKLYDEIDKLKNIVINDEYEPYLVKNNKTGESVELSPFKLKTYDEKPYIQIKKEYISEVIDEYFYEKIHKNKIKQKSSNLASLLTNRRDQLKNKIPTLYSELKTAENADDYKLKGELLTANIYKLNRGMEEITLNNYYKDNEKLTIELDSEKKPAENTQMYFKKYNKMKNAQVEITKQIKKAKEELEYIENIINSLENAQDFETVSEIKDELIEAGYINKKKKSKKSKKSPEDRLKKYISSNGFEIYAGKNNKQNDFLTLKFANKNDLWFHTKDLAGTHVVVKTKGQKVDKKTIKEAGLIAAYNSKGKMSSNVPVDYTEVKNVSKPSGAKPGMVIYVDNNTIYITPELKEIEKLKKIK